MALADDPNAWANLPLATVLAVTDTHGDDRLLMRALRRHGHAIDLILHLGDHAGPIERLASLASQPLIAVAGNCDGLHAIRSGLPDSLRLTVAGWRLFLTHGHRFGVRNSLDELALVAGEEPVFADLVLFGHTHRLHDETRRRSDGQPIRLYNPGSAAISYGNPDPACALIRLCRDTMAHDPNDIGIIRLTPADLQDE